METITKKPKLFSLIVAMAIFFVSCGEDDYPIPEASTQANFSYEVNIFLNENTGELNFEVEFTNKSIRAAGFHWDFGNNETSTEENPTVIYTEAGMYEVTLEVEPEVELHYNKLEHTERVNAVATIFEERFDDPALDTDFPPEGWKLIDADGDGRNWYWDALPEEDEYYILSDSWHQPTGDVLTPDNWIITPQIDVTDVGGLMLEFEVAPRASGPEYRTEKYGVFISTTGREVEDFELVYEERISEDHEQWGWELREVDLSDYAGEEIYIAFRHFDSTDLWSVALTNIHVYEISNK